MISNLDRYERIAPYYDLIDLPFESRRYRALRPLLFRGLSGRLLEAGVGTGRNFPFYPMGVSLLSASTSVRACWHARSDGAVCRLSR